MNLIKRTIDIQEKLKIVKNLFTKSMESCPFVISHNYFGRVPCREGDIHNFLLNGLSKFAQNFTVGILKLLSTYRIHIVVWETSPLLHLSFATSLFCSSGSRRARKRCAHPLNFERCFYFFASRFVSERFKIRFRCT